MKKAKIKFILDFSSKTICKIKKYSSEEKKESLFLINKSLLITFCLDNLVFINFIVKEGKQIFNQKKE